MYEEFAATCCSRPQKCSLVVGLEQLEDLVSVECQVMTRGEEALAGRELFPPVKDPACVHAHNECYQSTAINVRPAYSVQEICGTRESFRSVNRQSYRESSDAEAKRAARKQIGQ